MKQWEINMSNWIALEKNPQLQLSIAEEENDKESLSLEEEELECGSTEFNIAILVHLCNWQNGQKVTFTWRDYEYTMWSIPTASSTVSSSD